MGVTIEISSTLLQFTDGKTAVNVNGDTVKECLTELAAMHPKMSDYLYDMTGTLKIMVILNGKALSQKNLDAAVSPDDNLTLLLPMPGG